MSRRFGRFIPIRLLGTGGAGELYLASAPSTAGFTRPVVIKVPRVQRRYDQKIIESLKSEARLLAKIKHGQVASFYEFSIEGGNPFIVMEYIEGRSLRDLLIRLGAKNKTLGIPLALYLLGQVLNGLECLHRSQVIHGDLHPSNIMITYEGEIKLIDFGLAKIESRYNPSEMKTDWVTPAYASPSRLSSKRISAQDDIYGAGIVLWELCVGRQYWGEKTPPEIRAAIKNHLLVDPKTENPEISDELSSLIMRAMESDSFKGMFSIEELHRELHSILRSHTSNFPQKELRFLMHDLFAPEIEKLREGLVGAPLPDFDKSEEKGIDESTEKLKHTEEHSNHMTWERSPQNQWHRNPVLPLAKRVVGLLVCLELAILTFAFSRYPQIALTVKHEPLLTLQFANYSLLDIANESYLEEKRRQPAATLAVVVRSEPPGAQLFLVDRDLGVSTPARVELPRKRFALLAAQRSGQEQQWFIVEPGNSKITLKLNR